MSFSHSAGVITQTGTDTNLNGLAGLTGVTEVIGQPGTTLAGYRLYVIGSGTRLVVNGTLTIDPTRNTLMCNGASSTTTPPIIVNGVLNLGLATVVNSVTKYTSGIAINLTEDGDTFHNSYGMIVSATGTLNWNGATIRSAATVQIAAGATVDCNRGTFYAVSDTLNYQIRIESTTPTDDAKVDLRGLTLDGANQPARIFTKSGWNALEATFLNGQFQTFNEAQPDALLENFDVSGNQAAADIFFNTWAAANTPTVTVRNAPRLLTFDSTLNGANLGDGYVKHTRRVVLTFADINEAAISGVSIYGTDFDNGSRGVGPKAGQDDTASKVYTATNVASQTFDICLEVVRCLDRVITRDDRRNANGLIPLRAVSYSAAIGTIRPPLLGLGNAAVQTTLLPDLSITEANRATVDAYTEIAAAAHFYDRAKSWLVANYTGQTAPLVSRAGTEIDLGSYDLVIDATAAAVFAVAGNSITIKSSAYAGLIRTTGTVTLANGATQTGGIVDANGDSFLSFTDIDAWMLFASEADRNATTNIVASGTGTQTYRFDYTPGTTYWLWIESGGESRKFDVTPAAAGETPVSGSIDARLASIQQIAGLSRDHARAANLQTQGA